MEDACSSCLLRNKDRLSHLPDSVIYHILSFLDTKYAVQTSVLSRRWRCAWKYVTALHLHSRSFREYSSFRVYLDKVMSLRYPLTVREITLIDEGNAEDRDGSLFASVINYAIFYATQYLCVNLKNDDSWESQTEYYFSELFGTISDCNLKTLELDTLVLDVGLRSSGFRMLTKLEVYGCLFLSDDEEVIDTFSEFPCLEHLVLDGGALDNLYDDKRFRISGLRLLSLSVTDTYFNKLEIHAPKLKYLCFERLDDFVEFTKLNLPSLEYAEISVYHDNCSDEYCSSDEKCTVCIEYAKHGLISLLQGLSNVTDLKLGSFTGEILHGIPEFLKQQPSPFTRLETLSLMHKDISDAVINYIVKGSSAIKPVVKFEHDDASFLY
ncbi:F-box/LRR-repeat protein 13 [Linum perenne]